MERCRRRRWIFRPASLPFGNICAEGAACKVGREDDFLSTLYGVALCTGRHLETGHRHGPWALA
jgi:hypothetical protein